MISNLGTSFVRNVWHAPVGPTGQTREALVQIGSPAALRTSVVPFLAAFLGHLVPFSYNLR